MRFWKMPGPARFLDNVVLSTEEGLNVVIAAPLVAAGDLESALLERLRTRVVDYVQAERTGTPVSQVARALGIEDEAGDIDWLFRQARFTSSDLVHLRGITSNEWPDWKRFFEDYDAMSKDRPCDQRPKLLAVLRGMDLPREVARSVTYRGYRWTGFATELDLTLYVMDRIAPQAVSEGARLLASSIVAKIALGDVDLADALAERSMDQIWQPEDLLREWSAKYGWMPSTIRHWTVGTVFRVHGRDEVHSALVALDDPGGIIQARIWAAQAAILLPSIERERLRLVEKAREFLRPPFALYDGEQITDAGLLEIGPLAYQMKVGGAPREIWKRAYYLKEIRNKLAHMVSLSVDEALNSGLL
jgi:hypothetical protein